MSTFKRLIGGSLFVFVLAGSAWAQEQRAVVETRATAGPLVTVTASNVRVRFVSPGTVVQLRLEVYNQAGQKLFDTELRGGNVLDWTMQDGAGERLPAGSYACVLTIKSLSGRLSQRVGLVTVNEKAVAAHAVAQLSAAQQQTIGPVEENAAFTVRQENEALTAVTHDGADGQLTSTAGALTFRTGDVFAGLDKEHMRITPEGRVGIGTDKPEATLDVAGTIRTTTLKTAEGVEFADGSRLNSKDGRLVSTSASGEPLAPDVSGTGTTGRLTKWTNGPTGALGDSILGESGNGVELRSPVGGVGINPMFINPNNVNGVSLLQAYPASGTNTNLSLAVMPRGTGVTNNRAQITVFNTDFIANPTNYEFSALRARGSDFVFGTGKSGSGVNRPLMFAAGYLTDNTTNNGQFYLATNGNVGVGNTNPTAKLDVTGNVNTSTQYNLGGNRVLTISGTSGATTSNTFVGVNAGTSNSGGNYNSFFGNFAGFANTSGQSNSFFGANAGDHNIGGYQNAFFGVSSGFNNTEGLGNAFFGSNSGLSNTTEDYNTFLGADTNGAQEITNATAIGYRAQVLTSNSLVLGGVLNVNGATSITNVGIGTTAPRAMLDIQGGADSDGANDPKLIALSYRVGGYRHWIRTRHSSVPGAGNAIDFFVNNGELPISSSGPNNFSEHVMSLDGGKVGIGTESPKSKLQVTGGDIYVNSSNTGLILKSAGGDCFRIIVDNAGVLVSDSIPCPDN